MVKIYDMLGYRWGGEGLSILVGFFGVTECVSGGLGVGPGCSGCDWEMGRVGRREELGFFCFSGSLSWLTSSICGSSSASISCSSFPGSDGV